MNNPPSFEEFPQSTCPEVDLHTFIKNHIEARAGMENFDISPQTLTFMSIALTQFVHEATAKFIQGGKEHGDDFLNGVDHLKEMKLEIIDFFWYRQGEAHKKNMFDKRLNP